MRTKAKAKGKGQKAKMTNGKAQNPINKSQRATGWTGEPSNRRTGRPADWRTGIDLRSCDLRLAAFFAGMIAFLTLLFPLEAWAHHGGVSLPFGPGTPVETNAPLTLPEGGVVLSGRVEQVEWRKFQSAEPANKESFTFLNLGLSYGFKPYLTGSIFLPYNIKREESFGSNRGIGDVRLMGILGFNHDGSGLRLNSVGETAITLEGQKKTFFSFYGGFTFPTGKTKEALGREVDPSMQPGFGSPSFTVGFSAARALLRSLSLIFDTAYDIFTERDNFKFANEWRVNLAGVYELYGKPEKFISKVDGVLEVNFLNIGRDEQGGEKLRATGGNILYLSPGLRFAFPKLQNANLGILVKIPVYKRLNEQDEQQGSEGLEKYRLIATLSFYF